MKGQQEQNIEAMFKREAGELPSHAVRAPDGRWTASVPGLSPPKVATAEENIVVAEIPIGSTVPIHCPVFYEAVDPGGTLNHLLGAAAQKVQFQSIAPWAITIDNDYPAAWVEAVYLADQGKGKAAGHLKLAISAREDHPLLCVHDEVGYKETFRRVVQSLFQSFEPSQKPAEPLYLEVGTWDISEIPVGFSRTVLTKESGGRQRWTTLSLTMQPVGPAELQLEDEYEIEIIDAKKQLVSGHWIEASDGELTLNVKLERVKGNHYQYEGQVQGKPITGEFRTKSPQGLPSDASTAGMIKKHLAKSKSFSFSQEQYAPSLDPTAPQEITHRRNADDPPRAVRMQLGEVEIQGVVDEHGMMSEGHMQLGRHQLHFRREVQKGKP